MSKTLNLSSLACENSKAILKAYLNKQNRTNHNVEAKIVSLAVLRRSLFAAKTVCFSSLNYLSLSTATLYDSL